MSIHFSFQEAFFGEFFAKIPVAFRKNMLNYKLKLLDVQDPKVIKEFLRTRDLRAVGF